MAEQKRRAQWDRPPAGGEVSSNGEFTKVVTPEGEVEIIPTSEAYSKNPGDRMEGLKVEDSSVPGQVGRRLEQRLIDDLEVKFSESNEKVRPINAVPHLSPYAQVTKPEEGETGVEFDEGAELDKPKTAGKNIARLSEDKDGNARLSRVSSETDSDEGGSEGDSEDEGSEGFDPKDPRATPLADLPAALEGLSDADVKKAQKNDDRAGAAAIYEKRLSGE